MFGVFGVFVNACSRTHCVREHTVFENTCSRTHTVNTPVNTCSVCSVCSRTRVRVCSRIFVFGVFENTCSSVFVTKVRVFESVFRAVFDLCSRTRVRVCSSAFVFENNLDIYIYINVHSWSGFFPQRPYKVFNAFSTRGWNNLLKILV